MLCFLINGRNSLLFGGVTEKQFFLNTWRTFHRNRKWEGLVRHPCWWNARLIWGEGMCWGTARWRRWRVDGIPKSDKTISLLILYKDRFDFNLKIDISIYGDKNLVFRSLFLIHLKQIPKILEYELLWKFYGYYYCVLKNMCFIL